MGHGSSTDKRSKKQQIAPETTRLYGINCDLGAIISEQC